MNKQLENALEALREYGAAITSFDDKWIVEDNHIWGLLEHEKPMVMDEDEIIELAKQYTDFK